MSFSWLLFIPVLAVMVIIHEMGHLLTALVFKMKVNEFGIGFPPRLAGFKKGGILWTINALPIGGFVRILGENGDSTAEGSFGTKPAWQRAIVLASGALMNLVLALLLFFIVALGGTTESDATPAITRVDAGSPAAVAGLKVGDVFVSVDGNDVKMTNDVILNTTLKVGRPVQYVVRRGSQTISATITPRADPPEGEGAIGIGLAYIAPKVILTGSNLPGGLKADDVIVSANGQPVTTHLDLDAIIQNASGTSVALGALRGGQQVAATVPVNPQITYVYKNSAAANASVQSGMIVRAFNGQPVGSYQQFLAVLAQNQGREVTLDLYNPETKQNTPLRYVADAKPPKAISMLPDVAELLPKRHVDYGIVGSAQEAVKQAWLWTGLIPRTIDALAHGSIKTNSVAGPIGMAQLTGQVVDNGGGIFAVLTFTAILSINLFVFNLLPIPALDGGRFFFVVIEIVSGGRRVPPDKEGIVHLVGMILLLTFIALVSWQDIVRIVSGSGF